MRWHALSCFKGLLPRSDVPGAVQPTPCGLNRYVLLVTYCFYVFLTGCVYMGWTPLATMILRAGGYSFLCTADSSEFLEGPDKERIPGICNAQEAAVQKLYTVTLAVHCASSALAGALVDFAGPRLTALLGQSLSFAGWCLLASTTPTSRYTLPAAFVLIGLGVDTSVLPHLCITRLFPGSAGLVITITGSASSASMFVPLILESFGGNDLKACWVYAFVAPGCMFFVALILLPYKNFVVYEVQAKALKVQKPVEHDGGSTSDSRTKRNSSAMADGQEGEDGPEKAERREQPQQAHYHHDKARPEQQPAASIQSVSSSVSSPTQELRGQEDSPSHGGGNFVSVDMDVCVASSKAAAEASNCGFWRQVLSERYVLIVIYFVGVVWASSFYQQAPRRTFSTSVVSFLEVALPLSFIPCIIFGKIADVCGIVCVMFGLNTCGFLMYALAMMKKEAAGYASVVFFCLYMSLFMGQVFVYIEGTFAPQHFGKLVGLAAMVGGLLSLLCNLLYEVAVTGGERGLFVCQVTMLSLLVFQFGVLGRLYYHFRKNPHPYRMSVRSASPTTDCSKVSPAETQEQGRTQHQQQEKQDQQQQQARSRNGFGIAT